MFSLLPTPLNRRRHCSKRFEGLIAEQMRDNILTKRNIRILKKLVDEEMDGVARKYRQKAGVAPGRSLRR